MAKKNDKVTLSEAYPNCPIRNIVARFGDKWTMLILYIMSKSDGPIRYSELERAIPEISSRVLSSSLRTMEADDLVSRKVYPVVPPRVEYSLTETSKSLLPHLMNLFQWALDNFDHIIEHRKKHYQKSK